MRSDRGLVCVSTDSRAKAPVLLVLLLAVTSAGCGGDARPARSSPRPPNTVTASPTATATAPAPARFDPPVRFAAHGIGPMALEPDGSPTTTPVVWERHSFRVTTTRTTTTADYTNALTATDLLTGEETWTVKLVRPVRTVHVRPLVASIGGRTLVLVALAADVKGEGTEPVRKAVELVAADPAFPGPVRARGRRRRYRGHVRLPRFGERSCRAILITCSTPSTASSTNGRR
ncbi:hypothetical protein ACWGH8_14055 [Nonomuraea muscovyensis]